MADLGVPHVPPSQAGLLGGRMASTLGLGKIGVPLDKSGGVVRKTSFRNAMKHRLRLPGLQPSRRYLAKFYRIIRLRRHGGGAHSFALIKNSTFFFSSDSALCVKKPRSVGCLTQFTAGIKNEPSQR